MINGKVSGKTANVTVWDIVNGKKILFAELMLLRKTDIITVKPLSGNTEWFPTAPRIGKHPEIDKQFFDNFCNRTPALSMENKK